MSLYMLDKVSIPMVKLRSILLKLGLLADTNDTL